VDGRRAGRYRAPRLVAILALLVALTGCSGGTSVAPPKPPADSSSARVAAAQRTLSDLVDALTARDADRASALGKTDARAVLAAMARNVRTLGLTDLSLRFVDERGGLSADDRASFGPGAWAGSVELAYRISGWDAQPTRVETRFVFAGGDGGQQIAAVGGGDDRTPLWVTGPVSRLEAGRALVITVGNQGPRDLGLARRALTDVAKVLPAWHGRLVLEEPASEEQLNQALAAPEGRYANIAAVTTSVDGSLVPGAPVHVFLNPGVFDGLGPRGAQVVVSHESTHVATDATFTTDVPTWLLEGFADYVALAHAGIPVATAASQILARIRKDGPPDHLPTAADLDPSATGLGATYEEAWLATRFLGREYGEARLVTLYRKVSGGLSVGDAFRQVLGTTEAAFVRRWRADLRRLAGGVTS
jgi:hypothetical protein